MSELLINNYSRFERQKSGYDIFPFCVFVDPSSRCFNEIRAVEYVLHPSFPDPTRTVSERKTCFALESEAWGTFSLLVRAFKNNGEIVRATHQLHLEDNGWPMEERITKFPDSATEAVYSALFDDRYNWRKVSTIVRRSGLSKDQALDVLVRLEDERSVRKAYFQSVDKEDLWGATSVVGLLPSPVHPSSLIP